MSKRTPADPRSPVRIVDTGKPENVEPGVALCLSGGGYRAMLFHLGALWRLNELRACQLSARLERLGRLDHRGRARDGLGEARLRWRRRRRCNRARGRRAGPGLAGRTIDAGSIVVGILLPGSTPTKIVDAYRKHLLGDATLQDLPDRPRFVINATNVQTGALWRFSKPYMADYARRGDPESNGEARDGGRGVVGISAGPVAVQLEHRPQAVQPRRLASSPTPVQHGASC